MEVINYDFIKKLESFSFIEEIWLFGSRARSDYQDRSDIDLAILCPKATESDWHSIMKVIENADTLLKIDCVRFDTLTDSDKIKDNILKFKKVIYVKRHLKTEEIFWADYFYNLGKALKRLSEVINHKDVNKNDFMQDASIQRFEFVIEIFWKTLKKILNYEKIESTTPRDVLSQAYQFKLIDDEALWLSMLDDRNNTSHVYNEKNAHRIFKNIQTYLPVFEKTYANLKEKYKL